MIRIIIEIKTPVTGHLSEGSFVRKVVVQIPKFDARTELTLTLTITLALILIQTLTLSQALTLTLILCLYVSDKWPIGQVKCYQKHLTVSSMAHVPLFHQILWKSMKQFLV